MLIMPKTAKDNREGRRVLLMPWSFKLRLRAVKEGGVWESLILDV
jgi:hypothetical protein